MLTVEREISAKLSRQEKKSQDQSRSDPKAEKTSDNSKALCSLDKKQRRRRSCLGLHSLAEQPAGSGGQGARRAHPVGWEAGTHACTCLRAEGPGHCRRSLPDTGHREDLLCCAGNAGNGQTGGRSCPRRWGPRSRCTGTAGRAGGPQRVPAGPRKSHHHRSHSAALGKKAVCGGAGMSNAGLLGPRGGRAGSHQTPGLLVEQSMGSRVTMTWSRAQLGHQSAGCVVLGKPLRFSELGLLTCKVGE